jgi:thymidylate synthase (FAD)
MTSLLDHGYIRLIETWGSDQRVIEAARMSTDKGFLGWGTPEAPGDSKLLRYLWSHQHHTPFEMAGMTIEVQAPIFVLREWMRHRTQSYNEMSGRYVELPDLYYVPSVERLMAARQSTSNRQGSELGFSTSEAKCLQGVLRDAHREAREAYDLLLAMGVAREIARLVIPVAQFSKMRASANLRNWLGFLKLRTAPNAQWEIRQYANAAGELIAEHFPRTWELFAEGVKHDTTETVGVQ